MQFKAILGISIVTIVISGAARAESVQDYLRAFHANPVKEMQRLPEEVIDGVARSRGYINEKAVLSRMPERDALRAKIMHESPLDLRALEMDAEGTKDRPERIVEQGTPVRNNVRDLDASQLTKAAVDPFPWTDSYWPLYKGLLGVRYADKSFPGSKDWATNYAYVNSNPASAILAYGDKNAINTLSPAEKYDIAVGDTSFTLTRYSWNQGQRYYEKNGTIASWMGICHGWAGAAHMNAPIPEKPVTVMSPSGTPVTFWPQDVKALNSLLWANGSPETRFVGNRCNVSKPARDAYGRIIDHGCWDLNPGSWHIAITSQLGQNKRSFVMDGTYDAEVWNYPIAAYTYRYFNPQTWQETTNLSSAVIPLANYKLDKFRQYRSPKAKYIVGVYMDVTHITEINPTRALKVEPLTKVLRFIYDLELDENYNIVGGEWYSNAHPDFMWTFDKGAQATAMGDATALGDAWETATPVPATWSALAQRSSARGTPLFAFVRRFAEYAPGGAHGAPEDDGTHNEGDNDTATPVNP